MKHISKLDALIYMKILFMRQKLYLIAIKIIIINEETIITLDITNFHIGVFLITLYLQSTTKTEGNKSRKKRQQFH